MPLSVFAALELRPGPDSSGVWLNGSTAVAQVERGAAARPERLRREEQLGALARRMLLEPRRRARLLRRWWFGRGERGWMVELSADGVPHAVRRAQEPGTARQEEGTARQEAGTARQEAGTARQEEGTARQEPGTARQEAGTARGTARVTARGTARVEGDAASAPLYEKLSARRKWKARELLASADKGEGAAHLLVLEAASWWCRSLRGVVAQQLKGGSSAAA
jgi:hypothetical protein